MVDEVENGHCCQWQTDQGEDHSVGSCTNELLTLGPESSEARVSHCKDAQNSYNGGFCVVVCEGLDGG